MAKVCEITGKKVMFGNNVSHAMNKTRRRYDIKVIKKRLYSLISNTGTVFHNENTG